MDENFKNAAEVVGNSVRTFIILGWISAALTALFSPYFAIAGITFGILSNNKRRKAGNTIIITNVVLAGLYFFFRFILSAFLGNVEVQ